MPSTTTRSCGPDLTETISSLAVLGDLLPPTCRVASAPGGWFVACEGSAGGVLSILAVLPPSRPVTLVDAKGRPVIELGGEWAAAVSGYMGNAPLPDSADLIFAGKPHPESIAACVRLATAHGARTIAADTCDPSTRAFSFAHLDVVPPWNQRGRSALSVLASASGALAVVADEYVPEMNAVQRLDPEVLADLSRAAEDFGLPLPPYNGFSGLRAITERARKGVRGVRRPAWLKEATRVELVRCLASLVPTVATWVRRIDSGRRIACHIATGDLTYLIELDPEEGTARVEPPSLAGRRIAVAPSLEACFYGDLLFMLEDAVRAGTRPEDLAPIVVRTADILAHGPRPVGRTLIFHTRFAFVTPRWYFGGGVISWP